MADLTRGGVAYDFENTPFNAQVIYNHHMCEFKFSNALNVERFLKKQEEHRNFINKSLSNRFNLNIQMDYLSDVVLYKKIEKRGFLIAVYDENGEFARWLEKFSPIFDGVNVTN